MADAGDRLANGEVLIVIPARIGSQGIPKKNIRELGGKPLVAHTIEAALSFGEGARVWVSTDSPEVAEIARRHGAEAPFLRPALLSGPRADVSDVVWHAVEQREKEGGVPGVVVSMLPTHPFRPAGIVAEAVTRVRTRCVTVNSVAPLEIGSRLWTDAGGRRAELHAGGATRWVYRLIGAVWARQVLPPELRGRGGWPANPDFVTERLAAGDRRWETANSCIVLDNPVHWVDLDAEEDWAAAELLLRNGWTERMVA